MSSHQFAYSQQRRSTRIEQAMPLVVQGVGALREPYQEQVSTLSISCHGCTYQSKHEVIQGETVYLDIKPPAEGSVGSTSRARVKWVQKLDAKDRAYQIAVELEVAGNVWGVATPPEDWFPLQIPQATEPATSGRELKVVSRKEQPVAPVRDTVSNIVAPPERIEASAPPATPIAQLMVGLGEQIQSMASAAASTALVQEKSRILAEFRAQLQDEAVKTVRSAITASKEIIARQALKELSEAHESTAKSNYTLWVRKLQQDMESVRQHLVTQGTEVSHRLDGMAVTTIERVQRNMETTRSEAVDRFVARLREQVAPMLAEAKESVQKLEATEAEFKKESEAIYSGLESQLAFSANTSLARAQEELEKNSTAITSKISETLENLYQNFEKAAQDNVESLLASVGNQMTRMLQDKAAEVSRDFSVGLESYTRNYLESISKSIAQIPQNMQGHSQQ